MLLSNTFALESVPTWAVRAISEGAVDSAVRSAS